MSTIENINNSLMEEEEVIIAEIGNTAPGSATREDLIKELERVSTIRRENQKVFNAACDESVRQAGDGVRFELEKRRLRNELITKLVATGASVATAILILSFEKEGFIRSKIFGWIKFPGK